jgi:hypothetical protein
MLPNFIGIGAPKAGTTWLFRCLQEHPEVFVASCKETNFFDYATIEGRGGEYEAHFAGGAGFVAVGEISTRYLTSLRAPERIRTLIPDARLFVSLRNPIDQVYSHYWHLARQNFHQWGAENVPPSFEAALASYEQRLLEPALYHKHLRRWLEYFDRSQLLVILYDDIRARPREVLSTVYSFLGVQSAVQPPSLTEAGSSVRRGTSPKSPRLGEIHRSLYDQLNRNIYYPLKQLVGAPTAIRIKDALRVRPILESLFQQEGYPEMPPRTRALLRSRFAEDIRSLAGLIRRDLSHWT